MRKLSERNRCRSYFSTARNIFVGIKSRARNGDFHELMAVLEVPKTARHGSRPEVVDSSPGSAQIRDFLMKHPDQNSKEGRILASMAV